VSEGMAYVPNEVIATKLDALTGEVRELRRELVRRDVYEAERRADAMALEAVRAEVGGVKSDLATGKSRQWQIWLALAAAAIALGKDLVMAVLT